MRSHKGTRAAPRLVMSALVVAVCASLVIPVPALAVTNAKIREKSAEAAKAQERLDELDADFEMKVEDYNAAVEQLEKTTAELQRTQDVLAATEAKLSVSQDTLNARVDTMYRGGSLEVVEVIVGTTSFEDLATRVELLDLISKADAKLVSDVKGRRTQVADTAAALENRRSEQAALKRQAELKRAGVQAALSKQSEYVATLNAEVKRLMKEEEARQRRIAAERARQAREAAAAGAWDSVSTRTSGPLGSPHPEAVRVALRYIGVPYVWGGTTPSGFDCSGLMQYSYRQIGINLPRTSRSQYRVGGFIPESRTDLLAPGDLVFFGYGGNPNKVHHVGMYVGSGNFIHAPSSGSRVRINSLTERIRSRGDYVGGVRP